MENGYSVKRNSIIIGKIITQTNLSIIRIQLIFITFMIIFAGCNYKTKVESGSNSTEKGEVLGKENNWTDSELKELYDLWSPVVNKYGNLGQEFVDIYVANLTSKYSYSNALNASKEDLSQLYNKSLKSTSPGWDDGSKERFIIDCVESLEFQGITKNTQELCECVFENISSYYINPLIADVLSPNDSMIGYYSKHCIKSMTIKEFDKLFQSKKMQVEGKVERSSPMDDFIEELKINHFINSLHDKYDAILKETKAIDIAGKKIEVSIFTIRVSELFNGSCEYVSVYEDRGKIVQIEFSFPKVAASFININSYYQKRFIKDIEYYNEAGFLSVNSLYKLDEYALNVINLKNNQVIGKYTYSSDEVFIITISPSEYFNYFLSDKFNYKFM
ncbi:MAG: hypothetical protein K9H64_20425 [Bacteroidales bacterium]|nr:hypothetical protein [Bacteroidales bacterium]MCF8458427.1 hypothetical protein [Bacteroidales bacterium]